MTPIVPRETVDDVQLTAERVKQYIDAADNELGHWCGEPWVEKCRAILRAALATQPEQAVPKPWREAFRGTYPNYPLESIKPLDALTWAEKEIADLRSALAIPASAASDWNAAIEAAAKLMDPHNEEGTEGAMNADRIRALKRASTAASEQQPTKAEFGEYARQCAEAGTVPVTFSQFEDVVSRGTIPDSIAQISLDLDPLFPAGGGGAGGSFLFPTGGGGRDGG